MRSCSSVEANRTITPSLVTVENKNRNRVLTSEKFGARVVDSHNACREALSMKMCVIFEEINSFT